MTALKFRSVISLPPSDTEYEDPESQNSYYDDDVIAEESKESSWGN